MVLKSSSIIEVNLIYIISLSVAMDILSPRIQHIVLEEDIWWMSKLDLRESFVQMLQLKVSEVDGGPSSPSLP